MDQIDAAAKYINQYGFPIISAVGMGYIVHHVWVWVTVVIKPVLEEAHSVLIELIDQIRLLEEGVICMNQKINTTKFFLEKK